MFKIVILLITTVFLTLQAAPVLKTGQTKSYDVSGNEVTDGSIKDDGYYQAGVTSSYSRSGDVVIDNVTGLEWQDNIDSVQKRWVTEVNYNEGNYGDTSGDTAMTYCSELSLDGGNWRLPSEKELQTLVNYNKEFPDLHVKDGVFEHLTTAFYWSSTPVWFDGPSSGAWTVEFCYGMSAVVDSNRSMYARCVRGEELDSSNFSRNNETEIVTDSTTGLEWQNDLTTATVVRKWEDAIDYCENHVNLGGHNDWRLPNINELLSIVDYSKGNPAIDRSVFYVPDSLSSAYWSSTTDISGALGTDAAWYINFYFGTVSSGYKDNRYVPPYVRCVRGGQLDGLNDAEKVDITPTVMYLLD